MTIRALQELIHPYNACLHFFLKMITKSRLVWYMPFEKLIFVLQKNQGYVTKLLSDH